MNRWSTRGPYSRGKQGSDGSIEDGMDFALPTMS